MNMSLYWQRYHDPVASLKTFKSLLDIFQYLHTLGRQDTFNLRPCSHYYKNQKSMASAKIWKFCKHQFFVFATSLASETSEIFRLTRDVNYRNFNWSCSRKKVTLSKKKGRAPNLLDGVFELRWQLRKFWSVKNTVRTRNGFLLTEFLRSANRALYSK